MEDFDIKDEQLVAKVNTTRMVSPTGRHVDIPIENGFVGMVDRKGFDPFLRARLRLALRCSPGHLCALNARTANAT